MPSLISSILWVPRGVSARYPRAYDLADPGELERVERLGKIKLDDARRELEALEAQVDGMDLQDGQEGGEDDDSGDEWDDASSDDADNDGQSSTSEEGGDEKNPEVKARKAKARILGSQAAAMQTGNNNSKADQNEEDEMAKYNLDSYDDDRDRTASLGIFGNIKGVSFSAGKDGNDPHVTLANADEEDAEMERQELEILPTDNLLVAGKSADDVNMLEIHLFEGPEAPIGNGEIEDRTDYEGNMYVHHDTLLPALPICLEWGNCRPSTSKQSLDTEETQTSKDTGSFVAIGTMDNQIEIWDLDVVEGLYPEAILGDDVDLESTAAATGAEETDAMQEDTLGNGEVGKSKKKKQKKKKKAAELAATPKPVGILPYAHTDSVLSLAWNRTHRSLLASSSADGSIKLWDLSSTTCQRAIRSFDIFGPEAKIQTIQWNPKEPTVLIAGAWGGHIRIFDTRAPENFISLQIPGKMQGRQGKQTMQYPDVEVLRWDPLSETGSEFYVATSKGQVLYYDSKDMSKPVWTLDAHDGACSALDINEHVPGCFGTGGTDKQTKVWNVAKAPGTKHVAITLVLAKDFDVGKVFAAAWNPDDPCILACSGSNAKINVFDAWTSAGFRKTFGERIRTRAQATGSEAWIKMFREGGQREKASGQTVVVTDDLDSEGE